MNCSLIANFTEFGTSYFFGLIQKCFSNTNLSEKLSLGSKITPEIFPARRDHQKSVKGCDRVTSLGKGQKPYVRTHCCRFNLRSFFQIFFWPFYRLYEIIFSNVQVVKLYEPLKVLSNENVLNGITSAILCYVQNYKKTLLLWVTPCRGKDFSLGHACMSRILMLFLSKQIIWVIH